MYHDKFKAVLLVAIQRYDKAQTVYSEPDGARETEGLDVQLDYCEEAIIRTCLIDIAAVAEENHIDLADVEGDDEYIALLEEEPGRHMLQKAS